MSLMDYLIRKTSRKLESDEKIVDRVIRHQWKHASEVAYNYNQIEITGIGYFLTAPVKIRARIARHELALKNILALLQGELDQVRREKYEGYRISTEEQIDHLNKRLQFHESRLERARSRSLQQDVGKGVDQGTSRV